MTQTKYPFVETTGSALAAVVERATRSLAERGSSWIDAELLSFVSMQESLWVHDGELVLDGSFAPPHAAVLVLGDLVVSGSVLTGFRGGPSSTFLLVLGQVRCTSLLVEHGATSVFAGGLVAREAAIADMARDTATYVGRSFEVGCLVEGRGADIRVEDTPSTVKVRVDFEGEGDGIRLWRVFPQQLLALEEELDEVLRLEAEGDGDVVDLVALNHEAVRERLAANLSLGLRL